MRRGVVELAAWVGWNLPLAAAAFAIHRAIDLLLAADHTGVAMTAWTADTQLALRAMLWSHGHAWVLVGYALASNGVCGLLIRQRAARATRWGVFLAVSAPVGVFGGLAVQVGRSVGAG